MLNLVDDITEQRELTKAPAGVVSLVSTPGNPFMQSSRMVSDPNEVTSTWVEAGENSSGHNFIREVVGDQLRSVQNDLERAPNSPYLLNNLGLIYLNAGLVEEATKTFENALRIKQDLTVARLNLAKAQLIRGDLDRAVSIYCDLLKEHPQRPVIHENLGSVYLRLAIVRGDKAYLDQAAFHLKEAGRASYSSLNNLGIVYMIKGDLRAALGSFKKALALEPRSAKAHFNVATCYAQEKQYDKAVRHFASSLSLDAHNLDALKGLARVYLLTKQYSEAGVLLSPREETFANDSQLLEMLSETYFYSKSYPSCLKTLSRALKIYEQSKAAPAEKSRVYNNLGCASAALGEKQQAEVFFRKALKESSDVIGDAHTNLVDLLVEQRRYEDAFLLLRNIESEHPDVFTRPAWQLRFSLLAAHHYLYKNDYEAASYYLLEAQKADQENIASYVGISYLLTELQADYSGSLKWLRVALQKAPDNLLLLNNLAYTYLMKGDIEKGRSVLDSIANRNLLENPHLFATRGLLLIKEGAIEEGAHLYNQAIDLAPDKETTAQIRQKKNLELARYWLNQGKPEKAKRLLQDILEIESHLDIYKKQASTLLQAC
ncbi:MAG: tetratricopeptide repeat protein [Alphaproteobacteria bacterium]|nr:tetratricopeptide repeat protein [Alphaproteobacteria bacterium]